jgi:predicted nucleic acid-binding protein
MFLECVASAQAHYLVTGNRKHFPELWRQTHIVTARQLLDAIADCGSESA